MIEFSEMNSSEDFSNQIDLFGKSIKKLRSVLKLKQRDLRNRSKLTQSQISIIENGKGNFTLETILKVSSAFAIETCYFFNCKDNTERQFKKINTSFELRFEQERKKLGIRILQLCKHREQKQDELAILANIDAGDINNYIKGEENIEFYTLIKIATALEVDMFCLFDYDGKLPDNSTFKGKI